ncbi:MAG: mandelate racemase/muconate lactonizing enzyme family protein [Mangrovibacterium sp.]
MNNKIRSCSFFRAQSVLDKAIADSTHRLTEISFLVVRLQLENGISGESHLLSFQYSPNAIKGALKDHGNMLTGMDISDIGKILEIFNRSNEYFGNEGVNRWAQAAVNVAMWDAWCKILGQPVWKVFGTYCTRVPVYGSGGWLSYTPEELIDEVTGYKKRGFQAVKIKVGNPDWKTDLERLKMVRSAVGKEIDIMMDANQGMDVSSATQLALAARDLDIHWFEEPLVHTDFDGYQMLKQRTSISLAMGEREYSTLPLRELLLRKAIDIWQPDIIRIGGVDAWRKSAVLSGSFHIPVLPHYYKEYDVPLLCTIPNGKGAESFDWLDPLIDFPLKIENGMAFPHDRSGWGFSFKESKLTEI